MKQLKVGIIGCGLIGNKRAMSILDLGQDKVTGVCDIDISKSRNLSKLTGAVVYRSWESLVKDSQIDCIIVAT